MRVLVVGSYPPPERRRGAPHARDGPPSRRAGQRGRGALDAGIRRQTCAGRSQDRAGALQTLRAGRRYDSVVVQVETNTPLRTIHGASARRDRVLDCLFLGIRASVAARRRRSSSPTSMSSTDRWAAARDASSGPRADRLLVGSEYTRARLVEEGGADAARIEIMGPLPDIGRHDDVDWAGSPTPRSIMEEVRRRAATDRRAVRHRRVRIRRLSSLVTRDAPRDSPETAAGAMTSS